MSTIESIERLVNEYIECWKKHRPQFTGIWEDNDFGCEGLQVFRNGFEIQRMTHDDLMVLCALLTRQLRGQMNRDHKILWSWSAFVARYFREVTLFREMDWLTAFESVVQLLLASQRHTVAGPELLQFRRDALRYVNDHLLNVEMERHTLAGAPALAVLEGTLRRKNRGYVGRDGVVIRAFSVVDSSGANKSYAAGRMMNRIDDSFRLLEQITAQDRGRTVAGLSQLKREILELYQSTEDPYDLIDEWRNDLVHGKEYWRDRVPVIMNTTSLLVIDEIEPSEYDNELGRLQGKIERGVALELSMYGPRREIFPPDL